MGAEFFETSLLCLWKFAACSGLEISTMHALLIGWERTAAWDVLENQQDVFLEDTSR